MKVSPTNDPMSIFVDGKLIPGVYKIQNLYWETYLEIVEYSKELCCRPTTVLSPQDALVNLDGLLILEQSTFLTLRSGNFSRPGQDTRSKRCARLPILWHSHSTLVTTNVPGGVRSTTESRNNTAARWKGCSSDSGTRSQLRRSPRPGGSRSWMRSSFEDLVMFGEFILPQASATGVRRFS